MAIITKYKLVGSSLYFCAIARAIFSIALGPFSLPLNFLVRPNPSIGDHK